MHLPQGFGVVTPYRLADDAQAEIRFLVTAFGDREVGRNTTPDGRIAHCQLSIGGMTIMVSSASAQYPATRAALYLYVEDADATLPAALQSGIRRARPGGSHSA